MSSSISQLPSSHEHIIRYSLALPPSLTPAAMKKLVEKRNAQFHQAVNELVYRSARVPPSDTRDRLLARTSETEDPVSLLQASGRKFTPVNTAWSGQISNDPSEIPSSEDRPSVAETIEEMKKQNWYQGQITFRQETEEKVARSGLG